MGTTLPINGSGTDGDIYFYQAGSNSNTFIQRNNIWVSIIGVPITVSIPDNTTNFAWLTVTVAVAQYMAFDYSIKRGSNLKMGKLNAATDGASLAGITEYGIIPLGSSTGVTFGATYSGGNLILQATTTSQGISANLEYFLRSWN